MSLLDILGLVSPPNKYPIPQWSEVYNTNIAPRNEQIQQMMPEYVPNEQGVRDLYKSQLGTSNQETTNLDEYFPLLAESNYVKEKSTRPGMYELLMLMGLRESTGGKNAVNNNIWGAKPNGKPANFNNIKESVDYQLGPNVLGGGVNDSLNLLKNNGKISEEEIRKIMKSYNPEQVYVEWLIKNYKELVK